MNINKKVSTIKSVIKNAVFLFLHTANPHLRSGASILMYHSISTSRAFFTVSPYQFERQLAYLVKHNYKIIKLSELIRKLKNDEDISTTVCLTFDDGYKDNYEQAFPLLKKYKLPATIFVVTGHIGKTLTNSEDITLPLLSKAEIKEMHMTGLVEFMPHTHHHAILTHEPFHTGCKDIEQSRTFLEELLTTQANVFSYPQGKYTKEHIEYLKNNHFDGAVTVSEGLVRMGSDPYQLKRNSIDSTTTFIQFKGKVSVIDFYQKLKHYGKQ